MSEVVVEGPHESRIERATFTFAFDEFARLVGVDGHSADLELNRGLMTVQVRRQPRGRCAHCGLRRVLYRIAALMASGTGETEARCAPCWGIRVASEGSGP